MSRQVAPQPAASAPAAPGAQRAAGPWARRAPALLLGVAAVAVGGGLAVTPLLLGGVEGLSALLAILAGVAVAGQALGLLAGSRRLALVAVGALAVLAGAALLAQPPASAVGLPPVVQGSAVGVGILLGAELSCWSVDRAGGPPLRPWEIGRSVWVLGLAVGGGTLGLALPLLAWIAPAAPTALVGTVLGVLAVLGMLLVAVRLARG